MSAFSAAEGESFVQYGIRWHEYPDDPVELRDSLADAQDVAAIYKSQPLTVVQRTVTASAWEDAPPPPWQNAKADREVTS